MESSDKSISMTSKQIHKILNDQFLAQNAAGTTTTATIST